MEVHFHHHILGHHFHVGDHRVFSLTYFEHEFVYVVGGGAIAEHLAECSELPVEFGFLDNNAVSDGVGDA